jgi:outer membrane lipoprotein-sorting protein
MHRHGWICGLLPALLAVLLTTSLAAQGYQGPGQGMPLQGPGPAMGPQAGQPAGGPAYRVAERSDPVPSQAAAGQLQPPNPNEHPLMPALRWAREGIAKMDRIQDYSATVVKRERIGGKLNEHEYMYVKVRHKPFSVYMYFIGPAGVKGQECLYVSGVNNGNMWAHGVGIKQTMFGTVSLKPDGPVAMSGQRYPITELGVLNLTKRLVEVAEQDVKYDECEVKTIKGAKINDRPCTCIQVMHPVPRRNFLFHIARIFVDDELNVPVRYEAYDWPKEAGGQPELMEEYTYLNMKVNNGFTDADFDIKNPNYHFK